MPVRFLAPIQPAGMRPTGAVTALWLIATGCAAGDPSDLVVSVPTPAPPPSRSPASVPAARLPDGIPLPAHQACVLASDSFTGSQTLFLSRDGGPFASTSGGESAILHIPLGPSAERSAVLQVDASGIFIQGYVRPSLYLHEPTVVAGVLAPQPTARLELIEAARAGGDVHLRLAVPLDSEIELIDEEAVIHSDCDGVSPTPRSFDLRSALSLPPSPGASSLRGGQETPLYVDPREAPRAFLRPDRDVGIEVLDARSGMTKIAWTHDEVVVLGWVPDDDLGPPLYTPTEARIPPEVADPGSPGGIHEVVVCPHDVPLVAVARGEQRTVGAVRAGVALGVGSRHGSLAPVSAWSSPVDSDASARWFTPTADLRDCRRVQ